MKALTLYVVLGETELMRLFSASGALLCLCVFLCFYYTLFTPLLISPHPTLCLHKAPPLRPMKSSPWLDPILDYIRFLGARFSRVIFHTRLFRPSFLI